MAGIPSVGDILMLSQLAWKIGRAFSADRQGAPAEFVQVETEVNGLAKALKLLAETLFDDTEDGVLSQAEQETRDGIATILLSAKQTLSDLDSLLDQYQVIRKHRTSGGYSIETSWSNLVLSSYKTMIWTAEGGNIQALRNMLQMHTSTISLTMQALQSHSLTKLENTIMSMVTEIHAQLTGNCVERINDVCLSVCDLSQSGSPMSLPVQRGRSPSELDLNVAGSLPRSRTWESVRSMSTSYSPALEEEGSELATSPRKRSIQSAILAVSNPAEEDPERRDSGLTTLPSPNQRPKQSRRDTADVSPATIDERSEDPDFHNLSNPRTQDIQPQEPVSDLICSPSEDPSSAPSRPKPDTVLPDGEISPLHSTSPNSVLDDHQIHRSATTRSQHGRFERSAFANSAILCELSVISSPSGASTLTFPSRGTAVEYSRRLVEDGNPMGIEMVEAMTDCRILVVRKREHRPSNHVHLQTSIWAFSNDGTVRMQQKLSDDIRYIPYISYFSPAKVSLSMPNSELRFHDTAYGARPLQVAKTEWVNYVLADEAAAAQFQNELVGLTLLATYRTEKTVRKHDGLAGVIAYQEQMCGMEQLRVWRDEGTGGVLAMIHFAAGFRNGYLGFWVNSSTLPVSVKDEGGKVVKVKGLRVPIGEAGAVGGGSGDVVGVDVPLPSSPPSKRLDPKRWVTGAKIEFATEAEKVAFLNQVREVQQTMVAKPELAGV